MQAAGVTHALCVAVNLHDLPQVLGLAERHANLYASVGVHPDVKSGDDLQVDTLVDLATHPRVVAIGETGLDYFHDPDGAEWQRDRFRTHIRAAHECGKPLIIHTRAAADDTLAIMREENAASASGVMHCFTESAEFARQAIDLGFLISFSGIVTFKNAEALREVVRQVPLDRLLIETDSPYLAPVPHRGKTNEPAYVRYVAEEIARVKNVPLQQIAEHSTANFFSLFEPPQ